MLNHPVIITPLRTYLYGQANFWMEVICIQYLLMEYLEKDNFLKIANANFIFACAKLIIKLHYVFNLCVRTIMWLVCRFGAPTKMAQLFSIPASLLTNAEELNSSWSFWRKFSEAWLSGTFESTTHHELEDLIISDAHFAIYSKNLISAQNTYKIIRCISFFIQIYRSWRSRWKRR